MKRSSIFDLFGVLLLLACSCVAWTAQDTAKPKPADDLKLEGLKWMLVQIDGVVVPDGPRQPYILFNQKEGTAGGNSGCNSYGGKYKIDGDKLILTDSMTTLMGCDPEGKTEAALYQNLAQVNRYKIEDDQLRLFKDDHLLLTFEPEKKKPPKTR